MDHDYSINHLMGRETSRLTLDEELQARGLPEALEALRKIKKDAAHAGLDLQVISSYRSFDAQLKIWSAKAQGKRAVHDDQGKVLNQADFTPQEWCENILRYSAFPGMSRHHWGTEFDIFDGNALPREKVSLTPAEVHDDGPMGKMHLWLDQYFIDNPECGLFRPYQDDMKGVAPERWHLSYHPLSKPFYYGLTVDAFISFYDKVDLSELALSKEFFSKMDLYYQRFFLSINLPRT